MRACLRILLKGVYPCPSGRVSGWGIGRDTKEFLFDTLRIQERNPETVDGLEFLLAFVNKDTGVVSSWERMNC
jgi:hypothetical protein